jgi:uncharacterized protein DUF5666
VSTIVKLRSSFLVVALALSTQHLALSQAAPAPSQNGNSPQLPPTSSTPSSNNPPSATGQPAPARTPAGTEPQPATHPVPATTPESQAPTATTPASPASTGQPAPAQKDQSQGTAPTQAPAGKLDPFDPNVETPPAAPAGAPSPRAKKKQGSQQEEVSSRPPEPPPHPKTEILDSSATSGALTTDGRDPVLDPPPYPSSTTTLVGGIIRHVDPVRNRLTIGVFSGDNWTLRFDERTHIFRNGQETTVLALKKGERVYIDTMLDNDNHSILARNIRLGVAALPADADGQVETVDPARGELTLHDRINSVAVHLGVNQETRISRGFEPATLKDIKPGSLVHVKFAADTSYRGLAREINIIAVPGSTFTFQGRLTYLDMHRGLLGIANQSDGKTYDLHFNPGALPNSLNLSVGMDAIIMATFEGRDYTVRSWGTASR